MPTVKFTGLKYDKDCGYYAVRNGRIVCPAQGISGMKADAEHALAWAEEETQCFITTTPKT